MTKSFQLISKRLIVAADLRIDREQKASPAEQAFSYLERICEQLGSLGVTIKINTIARILGARAVEFIHDQGLGCFDDLKLFDIGNTLENECAWIRHYDPLMLTVSERIKPAAFKRVQELLPDTLILPVGPLTDFENNDFRHFHNPMVTDRQAAVSQFFYRNWKNGAKGVICAPTDIQLMPEGFRNSVTVITPGIQTAGMQNDNSPNALTAAKAIEAGADALVVGRAITGQKDMSMYEAATLMLADMETAFRDREQAA